MIFSTLEVTFIDSDPLGLVVVVVNVGTVDPLGPNPFKQHPLQIERGQHGTKIPKVALLLGI